MVESTYLAPDHFQGYPGVLHGGIVAAIVDEIAGRSLMGSDPMNPRFMFTAKMEVKYRRNVPIGRMLKIIGKAGKSKTKSAEAWAGIYDAETNELLAEGNVLLIDVPTEQFDRSRLSELGWNVHEE
jgi:acyl-coenzyme A thioesterase PaaI-like protein